MFALAKDNYFLKALRGKTLPVIVHRSRKDERFDSYLLDVHSTGRLGHGGRIRDGDVLTVSENRFAEITKRCGLYWVSEKYLEVFVENEEE